VEAVSGSKQGLNCPSQKVTRSMGKERKAEAKGGKDVRRCKKSCRLDHTQDVPYTPVQV